MDAVQLIGLGRCALAQSQEVPGIMAEAWQVQALAQAVGSRLAVGGPPELRGEALSLSEVGGRGCGALGTPALKVEDIRASRLSEIGDARQTLLELGVMLGELGITLVGTACSAEEDGIYWQCMEAIDAADEARDRVVEMLRKLAAREESLPEPDSAGTP
ncbi:hypothetical protein GCM10018793_50170 [Streptomyces sulfonofaciens]|uniref:Uncharacterized protein n=1 Tax=Streptomyces sulfonofaciens TaxID=68272 RepID=A0A919L4K8_9ACTN|nr:DUF6099 family protein [Streptomyces sulfonofaciens]GHH84760.1 hypothetical protein GCM10018793_50170 [Streptomyces sulfonofaciens]